MYQALQGGTYSGIKNNTSTLSRKFHPGGILLVASGTKLQLEVMGRERGIDPKSDVFSIAKTYGFY
jgi:hypothetical protein